jgi:predicted Zn-dependent peptidase
VLGVYAGAAADRSLELADLCAVEILDLAEKGPTPQELARAKAVLNASLWMSDESPASRSGRLAGQTLVFGAPVSSEDSAARIDAQTAGDLREVGRAMAASGLSATAVLGPKAAGGAGRAFRSRMAGR